jgi:hypothetical protein
MSSDTLLVVILFFAEAKASKPVSFQVHLPYEQGHATLQRKSFV